MMIRTILLLAWSSTLFAQPCAIYFHNGDSVSTSIIGSSSDRLYIDGDHAYYTDISLIRFGDEMAHESVMERIKSNGIIIENTGRIHWINIAPPISKYVDSNGSVYAEQVVPIPGVSKDKLYFRAKAWYATSFRSAQDVIQFDSRDQGKIIGKGYSNVSFPSFDQKHSLGYKLYYTLTFESKNDRIRISISQVYFVMDAFVLNGIRHPRTEYPPSTFFNDKFLNHKKEKHRNYYWGILDAVEKEIEDTFLSIQTAVRSSSDDDW